MATKSKKQREFDRIAPSAFRLPVPVVPKLPDVRKPQGREEFDANMEEWRKKLDYGQGDSFSALSGGGTIVAPGGPTTTPPTTVIVGTPGEKGEKGETGAPGTGADIDVIRIHVWIAIRTDNITGRGVQWDPYDGSTTEKLDTLLRSFPTHTVIHFGPGTFTTRGYPTWPIALAYKWQLKTGWKLIGSGIDQTTIKLADQAADVENFHAYIAYSADTIDDVEISDLTFDCNIQGQTVPVKTGAMGITGSRTIVRRVRIKNWGTTTTTFEEPFAMGIGLTTPTRGDVVGCLCDGVLIDKPAVIDEATGGGTMMAFGGGETGYTWTGASITRSGTTATLTLAGAAMHGLSIGQWFRVRTATQAEYNGSFQVSEVVSASVIRYQVTGSPATPATGTPQIEHAPATALGTGMLRNLVVRNCVLDGTDHTGTAILGMTVGGVDGAIFESNTIRNVTAAFYMDTFRGDSIILRNNCIQSVVSGMVWNIQETAWAFDTVVIEENLIELRALPVVAAEDYVPMVNTISNAVGVTLGGGRTAKPYSFRQVVIRNNTFRFASKLDSASFTALAVTAASVDLMIVTGNIIGFREPRQIRVFDPVETVIAHGNRNLDGAIVLVRQFETDMDHYDPDIELDRSTKVAWLGL